MTHSYIKSALKSPVPLTPFYGTDRRQTDRYRHLLFSQSCTFQTLVDVKTRHRAIKWANFRDGSTNADCTTQRQTHCRQQIFRKVVQPKCFTMFISSPGAVETNTCTNTRYFGLYTGVYSKIAEPPTDNY